MVRRPPPGTTSEFLRTDALRARERTQPPSREGKKALTVYVDPETIQALKIRAARDNATMQELVDMLLKQFLREG